MRGVLYLGNGQARYLGSVIHYCWEKGGGLGKLALTPVVQASAWMLSAPSETRWRGHGAAAVGERTPAWRWLHIPHWAWTVLAKPRNITNSVCKKHGLLSVTIWERKSKFGGNFGMVGAVIASRLSPGGEWRGERQQEEQGCAQPAQVKIRTCAKPLSNQVHQT